jgi:iron complex transport system substrate-binding protein
VSYNPALTEILFELGLENFIVGTTSFSNYPPKAQSLPHVGSYFKPNIEKTLSLKPTHVLVMKEGDPSIHEHLKKAKIPFTVFESRSLRDYLETLKKLGELFNVRAQAVRLIEQAQKTYEELPKIQKTITIQIDHNPLIFAGRDTFLSEALAQCGLTNLFKFSGYQKVSLEQAALKAPDVLIVVDQLNQNTQFKDVQIFWKQNPFYKKTHIHRGDADTLSRLGPRLPAAIQKLCREIAQK